VLLDHHEVLTKDDQEERALDRADACPAWRRTTSPIEQGAAAFHGGRRVNESNEFTVTVGPTQVVVLIE